MKSFLIPFALVVSALPLLTAQEPSYTEPGLANPDPTSSKTEKSEAKATAGKGEVKGEVKGEAKSAKGEASKAENGPTKLEPGHSVHGEAFNEGPRQAAVLMEGTGNVDFPITTKDPIVRQFFNQGVGQLHGFWYFEAERSFRQVAKLDPECATAYWGMAMANINNPKRAASLIQKAVDLKEKVSKREQLWIEAWSKFYKEGKEEDNKRRTNLIESLEEISRQYPEDIEAKAFLVFQIWDNKNHGVALGSRQAVEALAQQVLAVNPIHPGAHHYLIHLWNSGKGNENALRSAAAGGPAAPAIAHLWHMPGHTYSGLRRYADAAWQQEASARVDHAQMIANRIIPDQIHNFAHNNAWLIQDLRHIGRVHDALALAKNMIELPRLASKSGSSYGLGRDELLKTLLQFELWKETVLLADSPYLSPFEEPADELRRLRLLGLAHFGLGDLAHGLIQIEDLKTFLDGLHKKQLAAAAEAEKKAKDEKKSDDEQAKAIGKAMLSFSYSIGNAESAIAELNLARALAENDLEEAKVELEKAKDIPAERLARWRMALGQTEEALKLAREAAKADDQQVQPQANLALLLWLGGQKEEALTTFKKLRQLSGAIDLDIPTFAHLKPLATELHLPEDWRLPAAISADTGFRPNLESLGPFRWHPYAAPAWSLADEFWINHSLSDYRGRPVLVLFYLGSSCSHCIEQLNLFGPMAKQYHEAGISIIAVSSDAINGLNWTVAKSKDSVGFPFPIVSDETLTAFKAYRAFDDFENTPLHGSFLIDGNGLVRWQDISHEPFRDPAWLLTEAKRLLSLPRPKGEGVPIPASSKDLFKDE